MSTPAEQQTDPTKPQYQCGGGKAISFQWTRRMPENGRLGTVTIGEYVNKPIQVFDAKKFPPGIDPKFQLTDWTFQAQDGSFLGHLYVSALRGFIRFANFRPGDKFPQVSCAIPRPEPGDDREPLDRVA